MANEEKKLVEIENLRKYFPFLNRNPIPQGSSGRSSGRRTKIVLCRNDQSEKETGACLCETPV